MPWRSLVASVGILIVLALPVLDLQLGASDNGELPKSTTARQAYDLMTEGFGPGSNGPLLIGVELGSPAKADQSQIKQVDQKQDQLNQQIAEQEQQLEATGRARGAGAAAGRAADPVAVAAARPAEAARRVAGHRHAADRPRERDQEGPGHQVRLAGDRRQEGHGRGLHGDHDHRALFPGHDRHGQPAARPGHPERDQGQGHDRVRRRPDGRLHRPRRAHRRQAAADDPDRRRAQLHRA